MLSMEIQNFLCVREDGRFTSGSANQKSCWVKLPQSYALGSIFSYLTTVWLVDECPVGMLHENIICYSDLTNVSLLELESSKTDVSACALI